MIAIIFFISTKNIYESCNDVYCRRHEPVYLLNLRYLEPSHDSKHYRILLVTFSSKKNPTCVINLSLACEVFCKEHMQSKGLSINKLCRVM